MNFPDKSELGKKSDPGPEGYGYGGYEYAQSESQTLRDFFLVLREKLWYFLVAFLAIVTCAVVYCYKATPIYQSTAMIQVLRDDNSILGVKTIESSDIRTAKDLNTQVKILESMKMISSVAEELKGDELEAFMEPYQGRNELLGPLTTAKVLSENRKILPMRTTLMVGVEYEHPDPKLAAKIANLFAEKYIDYKVRLDIENSMKAVDDLKVRVDQQRMKVEEIETKMSAYRERHASVSLEAQADIDHKALSEINSSLTLARTAYDQAKGKWDMIQEYRRGRKALVNLPFIGESQQLKSLLLELSAKKILINEFSKRYGEKHPKMVAAINGRDQVKAEINEAVVAMAKRIESNYLEKKAAHEVAMARLKEKEGHIIALSKLGVEYNSLTRDLEVNQALYQSLVMRMNTEVAQIDLVKPNARIIDKAAPPAFPTKPRKIVIMVGGIVGGILLGVALVLVMAYVDDRARTSFDVESVIGLPLLGVVPRMKSGSSSNKAHTVSSGGDASVLESFRSVNSALKISNTGKDAQVIVCTSTQPSEGKTFFSVNFASMFIQHDERTILIDADLRMPRVGKLLDKEDEYGVIQYCEEGVDLDNIIKKDEITGLDLIPSGGRSLNPTRVLSSKKFANMVDDLRLRYDRIVIDSPPLGAVCDALNMLSCVDGLIYIIKFNATNRRAIKRNIGRILESGTPIIGAVINQVSATMSDYYYNTYYTSEYVQGMGKKKSLKKAA